jgi:probable rRNA maturation factor
MKNIAASAMNELTVRNRQRLRAIALPLLRQIASSLLTELLPTARFDIGIYVISAIEMARLNETFLDHPGSTDVITFPYHKSPADRSIHGEIFISMDDALKQAKQFRTSWQAEIVRYLVHGVLHLKGFDDRTAGARKAMKREENKRVKQLARLFPFKNLEHLSRKYAARNSPHPNPLPVRRRKGEDCREL